MRLSERFMFDMKYVSDCEKRGLEGTFGMKVNSFTF